MNLPTDERACQIVGHRRINLLKTYCTNVTLRSVVFISCIVPNYLICFYVMLYLKSLYGIRLVVAEGGKLSI